MNILFITIGLLLVICRTIGQLDQSVCIPDQPSGFQPGFKIPGNFSTRIDCQLLHKNITINMAEYHDDTRARGALVVTKLGTTSKVIYSTQDMQILFIKNGECTVFPIPGDVNPGLMWLSLPGTDMTVFTTIGLMKMANTYHFRSGHSRRIRGLLTNTWTTCIYMDVHNVTLSITLYFTNSRYWQVSSAAFESSVLARAEVIGRFASPISTPPASSRDFHMIYDYYDYSPEAALDDALFQPDPGIYCPGQHDGPGIPSFPTAFHLTTENVEHETRRISNYEVIFDDAGKLARTVEAKLDARVPYFISNIYDYITGVIYTTDSRHDTCSVSPIRGFEPFTAINSNPPSMIRGADYFMSNNDNTQHVGKRRCRGTLCDVWIAVVFDIKLQRNVTIEWYFANTQIHLKNTPDKMTTTKNIMHLDRSRPPWSAFDITECYSDLWKRLRFVIEFQVTSGNASSLNKKRLVNDLVRSVSTASYLQPIRIQQAEVLYREPSEVFFVATLLDRAPLSNPYFHVPNNPSLRAAYEFMRAIILDGLPIMVSTTSAQMILLRAVAIREIEIARDLIPTTDPSRSPTTDIPTTKSANPTQVPMVTPATKSPTSTVLSTSQSSSTILTSATTSRHLTRRTWSLGTFTTRNGYITSSTTPKTSSEAISENSKTESTCTCPTAATCPIVTCPITTCPIITCPVVSTRTCPATATCPTVTCPVITCSTVTCPIVKCPTVPQTSHLPPTTGDVLSSSDTLHRSPSQDRNSSAGVIVGATLGGLVGGLLTGLLIAMLVGRYRRHSKDGQKKVLLNFYINDDAKL